MTYWNKTADPALFSAPLLPWDSLRFGELREILSTVQLARRIGIWARVVSHKALKPFFSPRVWRLVESYLPEYRHFHQQLCNGGRCTPGSLMESRPWKAGKWKSGSGEPNAEVYIYVVRLDPNTTQRRGAPCLDFFSRANVRAYADGGSHDSSPFISRNCHRQRCYRRIGRFRIPHSAPICLCGGSCSGATHSLLSSGDRTACALDRGNAAQPRAGRSGKAR